MSGKGHIVFSTDMQSWDASEQESAGHGEKWKAEVALDTSGSRLTVFLTDAHGRKQEIGIEIDGREVGIYANTDVHSDAPLLAAKLGQSEAFVFEAQNTTGSDRIIRVDENGFSKADRIEFTAVEVPAQTR